MRFKLQPTAHANGLCVGCQHGQVMQFANGEDAILCSNLGGEPIRIRRAVVQCTEFTDRKHDNQWEMRKIAWTIEVDKKNGKVGFAPPKKDDL